MTQPIIVHDTYEYNFLFPNDKLGLELKTRKGRKEVWVSKVNIEELKHSIHINDIVISINNERVGKDISTLIKSPKRPLRFRFSRAELTIRGIKERKINKETAVRATGQQEIEDETADKEYNTNKKCMGDGKTFQKRQVSIIAI